MGAGIFVTLLLQRFVQHRCLSHLCSVLICSAVNKGIVQMLLIDIHVNSIGI